MRLSVKIFADIIPAALAQPTPSQSVDNTCEINSVSSRVCEKGSKSCTVYHNKPQPTSQDVLLLKAKRLLMGWAEWYGKNEPKALPPNSKYIVELIEDIDAAMKESK